MPPMSGSRRSWHAPSAARTNIRIYRRAKLRSCLRHPWPRSSKSLGDLFEHHFRDAAADRLDAGVARHALDGAFAHETHAAVKLHAIVHHGVDQLAAIGLHHRNLAGDVVTRRVAPGGGIDELASGLDLGRAHRQTLPDRLLVP